MANLATLREIETHWTLLDVLDAHELLDMRDEANHRTIDAPPK